MSTLFQSTSTCIIIPTYNNEKTLRRVLDEVIEIVSNSTSIIVINDGSTDSTYAILESYRESIEFISYKENQGKGFALRQGFKKAIELGFDNALTIDSDGQHYPEDMLILLSAVEKKPGSMIMGSRDMGQSSVPGKSSFGNRFSNFWFRLETSIIMPDTQTGFRVYPLRVLKKMRLFTKKFELEIEVIVRLAWRNVTFVAVPVRVLYDIEERVSHFRPGRDFFRISILNCVLVPIALLYYYPKKIFSKDFFRKIKKEAIKPEESNLSKALSLGFGCFMGIVPIWGFQLLIGIPLAIIFKMNKVLFIAAANISIPPMIPLIIYASFLVGQLAVEGSVDHTQMWSMSTGNIQDNVLQYIIGAVILAVIMSVTVFTISFILLKLFRKEKKATIDKEH
ncbi:MAG: glycosyltransferase involved in cell wall biosynthesis [Crocinitomix sp.]|jgi:glycosyltransferase involved in cell wall biosynthesis